MTLRAAILAAAALTACDDGTPELSRLRCERGENACQSPSNPYQLDLLVDFEDGDGDLSQGIGRIVLDDTLQRPFALRPVFQRSSVALDATSGTLRLTVNIDLPEPRGGTAFELGFEVEDAARNVSNRPTIRFRIDVP